MCLRDHDGCVKCRRVEDVAWAKTPRGELALPEGERAAAILPDLTGAWGQQGWTSRGGRAIYACRLATSVGSLRCQRDHDGCAKGRRVESVVWTQMPRGELALNEGRHAAAVLPDLTGALGSAGLGIARRQGIQHRFLLVVLRLATEA